MGGIMKKLFSAVALLGATCVGLNACDVDQTKEAKAPEVDVTGGQMPEYNVTTPDVNVTTEKKTVEVPTVSVKTADEKKAEQNQ